MYFGVYILLILLQSMGFTCFVCKLIIDGKLSKLLGHLHSAHALYDGPGLFLRCNQGGCPLCFGSFNSFRKHVNKHHQNQEALDHVIQGNIDEENTEYSRNGEGTDDFNINVGLAENRSVFAEPENSSAERYLGPFTEEINKQSVMFILGLLSRTNTTRTAVQEVVEITSDLLESIVGRLQVQTETVLHDFGIDLSCGKVQELADDFSSASKPFVACSSRFLQHRYFVQHLGLVEPQTIVLGMRYDTVTDADNGQCKQVLVRDTFQYIPMKGTLGIILSDKDIQHEVNNGHQSKDGVMRHYNDGRQYKTHPLFSTSRNSLQLCLFFDEYEVANPLGSKRGVHKIGALYYTLQNLSPFYNAALHNIHTLALFNCIDLEKYGFGPFLAPFLEELSQLESDEGMEINLRDGTSVTKRGTLTQLAADNLGANGIGGFVESFGANYPCRSCLTSRDQFKDMLDCDICDKRTRLTYQTHQDMLVNDPASVREHGVKALCPLNKSRFFHITTNYSPDIMHDILEGVGKRECKRVLSCLILDKELFSLDLLNARISNFSYGFADSKNKPSIIAASTLRTVDTMDFKNSAAQMWCFMRVLPLLVGDKVPRGDRHWELLLRLRRIMDIVFARETTDALCRYLRCLIQDHHKLFVELFPEATVTAKHHFMVHYPQMMQEVGPLYNCWCMRFEAKHAIGKRLAGVVCNFRDICFTIADRHQIRQCQYWYCRSKLTGKSDYIAKTITVEKVSETEGRKVLLDNISGLSEHEEIYTTKCASVHGSKYRAGVMVVVDHAMEMPVFGQVKAVYIIGETLYLFGTKWVTEHFDDHFHAYAVVEPSVVSHFLVRPVELKHHHLLHLYSSHEDLDRRQFVVTRSVIIG